MLSASASSDAEAPAKDDFTRGRAAQGWTSGDLTIWLLRGDPLRSAEVHARAAAEIGFNGQ
jgi:hypothetical protein